jgi:nicotinate-nucleotide--dimethylbenzimidazole phosphoribosyltransferase
MTDMPRELSKIIEEVQPLDVGAVEAARARHGTLTKPAGSLGRLEEIGIQLAGITGTVRPKITHKAIIIAAADHGVAAEGVSAFPSEVTGQMVANFLAGGAAINVLARRAGARVLVVDFGVASPLRPSEGLVQRSLGPGTANMAKEHAMTRDQAVRAILTGVEILEAQRLQGLDLVAAGEMGIANTTAASAVVAALVGVHPETVTGHGTGIDDAAWRRKVDVISQAIERHAPDRSDPIDVLARVGGFEIAGIAGIVLGAARARIPLVLDGFIASAGALAAVRLCPAVREYLIPSHRSVERGHQVIFNELGLEPLFDLKMRLGEGTGAALAMQMVEAAACILDEMATFGEAGVSGASS